MLQVYGFRTGTGSASEAAGTDDACVVEALRQGDEYAFAALIRQHHAAMVRVANIYVADRGMAEDITQETWLHVLQGIEGFEGRSALRTWIYKILVNRARTRAVREGRAVSLSAVWEDDQESDEAVVPGERFEPPGGEWQGHWLVPPERWNVQPELYVLSKEMRATIERTLDVLPAQQREVFQLRDIDGWSAGEVREVLNLSEVNQRVLLHRARAKVRTALERYWAN